MSAHDVIELRVPCSRALLPQLHAGVATQSIRLCDQGDGTHELIVVGPRGPLSDPFAGTESEAQRLARENAILAADYGALRRLVEDIKGYALTPEPVLNSIEQVLRAIAERASESSP